MEKGPIIRPIMHTHEPMEFNGDSEFIDDPMKKRGGE
jgi:hypothetical protein